MPMTYPGERKERIEGKNARLEDDNKQKVSHDQYRAKSHPSLSMGWMITPPNNWMSMYRPRTHRTTKNPQTFSGCGFLHFFGLLYYYRWCRRPDSNRHGSPHTPLKRARLPIPPLRQIRTFYCLGASSVLALFSSVAAGAFSTFSSTGAAALSSSAIGWATWAGGITG